LARNEKFSSLPNTAKPGEDLGQKPKQYKKDQHGEFFELHSRTKVFNGRRAGFSLAISRHLEDISALPWLWNMSNPTAAPSQTTVSTITVPWFHEPMAAGRKRKNQHRALLPSLITSLF
jgi:hypothetical protein